MMPERAEQVQVMPNKPHRYFTVMPERVEQVQVILNKPHRGFTVKEAG